MCCIGKERLPLGSWWYVKMLDRFPYFVSNAIMMAVNTNVPSGGRSCCFRLAEQVKVLRREIIGLKEPMSPEPVMREFVVP